MSFYKCFTHWLKKEINKLIKRIFYKGTINEIYFKYEEETRNFIVHAASCLVDNSSVIQLSSRLFIKYKNSG